MNIVTNPPATVKKTPTAAAIDTAIRNAAKMDAQGYEAYQTKTAGLGHVWYAIKPNTNRRVDYKVDTLTQTCECEFFKLEGTCKHLCWITDNIRLLELEALAEEEEAWRDFASLRDETDTDYSEPDEDMETRVCEYHGPHPDNLSFCPRCERLVY